MPEKSYGQQINESDVLNQIIRGIVLIIVALILAIVSVSFAVHHMRLKFEEEYRGVTLTKLQQVSDTAKLALDGDEIATDPLACVQKYSDVLSLVMADVSEDSFSTEAYGLFLYSGGQLSVLTSSDAPENFSYTVSRIDISDWLNAENKSTVISNETSDTVLVPIADSTGRCVAVLEYSATYSNLSDMGGKIEGRVLKAVIISVAAGILLFAVQLLIPKLFKSGKKGGQEIL